MKFPGTMAALLCVLVCETQATATTAPQSRPTLARVETHQVTPRDTVRAGQDIELRKVQAMLSRQGPPQKKKPRSRR
jgi:hypothetical protein